MNGELLLIGLAIMATLLGVLVKSRGRIRRVVRRKRDEEQRLVEKKVLDRLDRVLG